VSVLAVSFVPYQKDQKKNVKPTAGASVGAGY